MKSILSPECLNLCRLERQAYLRFIASATNNSTRALQLKLLKRAAENQNKRKITPEKGDLAQRKLRQKERGGKQKGNTVKQKGREWIPSGSVGNVA